MDDTTLEREVDLILNHFKTQALNNKPNNLVKFAYDYFKALYQEDLSNRSSEGNNSANECYSDESDEYDEDYDIMSDKEAKKMLMRVSDAPRMTIVGEKFDLSELASQEFERTRKIFPKSPGQLKKIQDILKSIFIFKSIEEEQMVKVIESMFEIEVMQNDVIIRENDAGDNFYLIDRGEFLAYSQDKTIYEKYHNNGFFGELALLYNSPRRATVIAQSDGLLWAIDRVSFSQLIMRNAYEKRKKLESLIQKVKIFHQLSEYDKSNLADALRSKTFTNEVIINEGDIGDKMFFIEQGEVMVTRKTKNDGQEELKRLQEGDYFGEVALIGKIPRIATVRAVGIVKVAELDLDSYTRLMGPCIEIMRANFPLYKAQLEEILSGEQLRQLFPKVSQPANQ